MDDNREGQLNVKAYILDLSKKHGVAYVETPSDRLANLFTSLSDDEVVLDEVELLIIALDRAGVIARKEVLPLLGRYLAEKRKV